MLERLGLKDTLILGAALAAALLLLFWEHGEGDPGFYPRCLLAAAAYIPLAWRTVLSAFKTLFTRRRMSEEFLMTAAACGAFGLGDFPEALAVMLFYRIGRTFEQYAVVKSRGEICALARLRPTRVRVVDESGAERILKPRQVRIGQTIRVLAGEAVALDGFLRGSRAYVSTAALTGESEPRLYAEGEEVPSGAVNGSEVIELTVSRLSRDSSITRLLNLLEDAAAGKSRPEALISRFARWYTPLVVGGAALLALAPLVLEGADWNDWITRSLIFLVVSCPCALVLSVPLAFFGGLGALSRIGVMVKGSAYIESLSRLKAIAFDKTGTVTTGGFCVSGLRTGSGDERELVETAMALESRSSHPLAQGVVSYARSRGFAGTAYPGLTESPGRGVLGVNGAERAAAGRPEFIRSQTSEPVSPLDDGTAEIHVARNGRYLGALALSDELRPEAAAAFGELRELGLRTCLITGDRPAAARIAAAELKCDELYAAQLPEEKLLNFRRFRQRCGISAYVGDGINDAPVLAAADVGIAMGRAGSALAVEAADVVVMRDDLALIPRALRISRRIYALALANLVFVLGVKLGILALSACGLASIWLAIFGDVGVLVLSVLNAMRALGFARERS